MTLNAWLDKWQRCSHTSDTSRDVHSYLMISASFNSIALTRDLTASCVSVCISDALRKWRTKSRAALRDQILCELNENATETYEKLRMAFGEHALLRTQVFRWHKAF